MKRLVLMGGSPWKSDDMGRGLVESLIQHYPIEARVAFCIFAQPESDWRATEQVNRELIQKFAGNTKISFQTMTEDNFSEVSEWADIINLPGGNPFTLKEKLDLCGDVSSLWDGKVIAGSSAGADVLCEKYMFLQEKRIGEGFGWIKASCLPHWRANFDDWNDSDWNRAEAELLHQHSTLPVLCIPEGKFIEIAVR